MPVERLDPRVVSVVLLLDDGSSFAEIWRRARRELEHRALPVPSYGAVRRIVLAGRYDRARKPDPGAAGGHVDVLGGRVWIV